MLCWWWIFYHCPDLLWVCIIKSLYGPDGSCKSLVMRRDGTCSWNGVIRMFVQLRGRCIDIQSLCPIRIGYGRYMSFWQDIWMGKDSIASIFHRVHALDAFRHLSVSDRMSTGWETTTL